MMDRDTGSFKSIQEKCDAFGCRVKVVHVAFLFQGYDVVQKVVLLDFVLKSRLDRFFGDFDEKGFHFERNHLHRTEALKRRRHSTDHLFSLFEEIRIVGSE